MTHMVELFISCLNTDWMEPLLPFSQHLCYVRRCNVLKIWVSRNSNMRTVDSGRCRGERQFKPELSNCVAITIQNSFNFLYTTWCYLLEIYAWKSFMETCGRGCPRPPRIGRSRPFDIFKVRMSATAKKRAVAVVRGRSIFSKTICPRPLGIGRSRSFDNLQVRMSATATNRAVAGEFGHKF